MGPLLSPIAYQLVVEYNVSFTKVSLLTGWQLLTVAICGFFISPMISKFGKRPVILVTSTIGLGGCIWLYFANSYNTIVGARVLQGISVSFVSLIIVSHYLLALTRSTQYEAVGFGIIADLYCVHERGSRIAAFLFPLGAFNVLCPLIGGVVAQNLGVPWMFRLMVIFAAIS